MTDYSNPRFLEAVAYIYPDANVFGSPASKDVLLTDDGSGVDQPELARWEIDGPVPTDEEVSAALAAKDARVQAEQARVASFKGESSRIASALKAARPSEIDSLVDGTDSRALLKEIVKFLVVKG